MDLANTIETVLDYQNWNVNIIVSTIAFLPFNYMFCCLFWRMGTKESDPKAKHLILMLYCFVPMLWLYLRSGPAGDLTAAHRIGIVSMSLFLLREVWSALIKGPMPLKQNLTDKVYIVTGGNSGVGLETARTMAGWGGTVVIGCRSMTKGEAARKDILKSTGADESAVKLMELDLTNLASIRNFVKNLEAEKIDRVDGLILNAGVMLASREETPVGIEMTMMCNHYGHFYLTNLLRPVLEKTSKEHDEARIVVIGSSMHKILLPEDLVDDVNSDRWGYKMFNAYSKSKLANMWFMMELQRQLTEEGSHVTVNSCHPGNVHTAVTKNLGFVLSLLNQLFAPVLLFFRKMQKHGAYTPIHVATNPGLKHRGGLYFVHCNPEKTSPAVHIPMLYTKFWKDTEETLVEIDQKEKELVKEQPKKVESKKDK